MFQNEKSSNIIVTEVLYCSLRSEELPDSVRLNGKVVRIMSKEASRNWENVVESWKVLFEVTIVI